MKYTRIEEKGTTNMLLPQSEFYPMPEIEIYDSPEYFAITNKLSELKDPNDKKALRDNLDINWKNIQGDVALSTSLINYINNPDNYWSTTVLNKVFKSFKTKTEFETNLGKGKINLNLIIFIEDTKDIWTQGVYYHCPKSYEELVELIEKVSSDHINVGIDVTALFTFNNVLYNKTISEIAKNFLYTINNQNGVSSVVTFYADKTNARAGYLVLTNISSDNISYLTSTITQVGSNIKCTKVETGCKWLESLNESVLDDYLKTANLKRVSVKSDGLMPSTMLGNSVSYADKLLYYYPISHNYLEKQLLIPYASLNTPGIMSISDKELLNGLANYSKDLDKIKDLLLNSGSGGNVDLTLFASQFLSKIHNDNAGGHLTFEKGATFNETSLFNGKVNFNDAATFNETANFKEGIIIGTEFNSDSFAGTGGGFFVDKNNASQLVVDYATIRRKAIFNEIEIKSLKHVGGTMIISAASCKIDAVVASSDSTKYYCLFKGKDDNGKTINNEWQVGDLARCLRFGIPKGDSTNVLTTYYWRKVIAVNEFPPGYNYSSDEYHVITLGEASSALDDAPVVGDEIVLFGHKLQKGELPTTNNPRCSAILLSAYEVAIDNDNMIQSPCMILYADITDFNLTGKAKQIWSPGKNLFSGEIIVGPNSSGASNFGDLEGVVNDKVNEKVTAKYHYDDEEPINPNAGDIWFSENGVQVYINGEWHPITDALLNDLQTLLNSLLETVAGTTATVQEFNARLDGKVTNWFFNGTPSLLTVPVSAWGTQYEEHIGDTFTSMTALRDNNNRSWQWIRSKNKPSVGSVSKGDSADTTYYYYWREIEDSHMIVALTAMARENKAADGKCTVFLNETPLNYLKGDLWIVPPSNEHYITEGTLLVAVADYKDGFKRLDWADKLSYPTLENINELQGGIDEIANSVESLNISIDALQKLIDGEIVSWFGTNTPGINSETEPLDEWGELTLDTCIKHLNDTYTNTSEGISWRWVMTQTKPSELDPVPFITFLDNNKPVYFYWCIITDTAAQEALAQVQLLQGALDGRVRIFYAEPKPPYAEGDVWFNGEELRICAVKKDTGSYAEGDWPIDNKYKDTIQSIVTESVQDINARLDGQIVTWYQDDDPSDGWKTGERENHIGDTWFDTDGTAEKNTYIYKKKNDGTYYWEETNDPALAAAIKDAKGIADGKRTTYVVPKPPTGNLLYGDIWVLTAAWTDETGIIDKKNTIYAKGTMFIYVEYAGWTDLLKYVDKSYVDDLIKGLSDTIKGLVDGKAEIHYQTENPANKWTDADTKESHVSDFWVVPGSSITKIYVKTEEDLYEWQETNSELIKGLEDSVDGKTALYASWELVFAANYKIGDVWILSENDVNNKLGFTGIKTQPPSWNKGTGGSPEEKEAFMKGIKPFSFYRAIKDKVGGTYNPTDWEKVVNYSTEADILKIVESITSLNGKIENNIKTVNGKLDEYLANNTEYSGLLKDLQDSLNEAQGKITALQNAQDQIPDLDALNNALAEVETITKNLEQAVADALNDGKFDWKEIQKIQDLQDQLNAANDALTAMENKLQQLLRDEIAKLSFSPNNLLRNSGFEIPLSYLKLEINSNFELNKNTLLSEGPLSYWTWLNVTIQTDAAFENYKSGSGYICQANTSGAYIQQNVSEVIVNETYIVTFKGYSGKGNEDKFKITFGGQMIKHQCSSLQPVTLKFNLASNFDEITNPNLFKIELPNGSVIFDLMLERGTIPSTQWSRNIQDSPVELAKLQSTLHIESAIAGYSDIKHGLILTNMLTLGDFPTQESLEPENASCGLNGKYSDKHNVAFWAGGNYENALNTANLMLGRPTYLPTAEELKNMASCIITHGGTAVLNEAIVRGSIYADRGYFKGSVYADNGYFNGTVNATDGHFKGRVEADSGYFKGTIEATDGVFENGYFDNVVISGTYNRRILHINKDNYLEFFVEEKLYDGTINLYPLLHTWGDVIYIDFAGLYKNARPGAVNFKFPYYFPQAHSTGVDYEKELGFIMKDGKLNSATVEDVRSLLGKKIMIYTKNIPGGVIAFSSPSENKTISLSSHKTSQYYSGKVTKLEGFWNERRYIDDYEVDHGYTLSSWGLTLSSSSCYILECILTKRECHVYGDDSAVDSDDIKGWFEMLAWTSEELTAADKYIDNWYRCAFYKYYESTGKSEFMLFMDAERGWTWKNAYDYDSGWSLGSFRIEDIEDNEDEPVKVTLDWDSTTYYVCSDIQGTRVKPTDTLGNVYYLSKVESSEQ